MRLQMYLEEACSTPKAHSLVIKLVTQQVKFYITELQSPQKTLIRTNVENQCKS